MIRSGGLARETLLTIRDVAEFLQCSVSTVRRLVLGDKIPHFRLGKLVRFRRTDIDGWLALYRAGELPQGPAKYAAAHPDQLFLFESEVARD